MIAIASKASKCSWFPYEFFIFFSLSLKRLLKHRISLCIYFNFFLLFWWFSSKTINLFLRFLLKFIKALFLNRRIHLFFLLSLSWFLWALGCLFVHKVLPGKISVKWVWILSLIIDFDLRLHPLDHTISQWFGFGQLSETRLIFEILYELRKGYVICYFSVINQPDPLHCCLHHLTLLLSLKLLLALQRGRANEREGHLSKSLVGWPRSRSRSLLALICSIVSVNFGSSIHCTIRTWFCAVLGSETAGNRCSLAIL